VAAAATVSAVDVQARTRRVPFKLRYSSRKSFDGRSTTSRTRALPRVTFTVSAKRMNPFLRTSIRWWPPESDSGAESGAVRVGEFIGASK
jgi:hypothetical protein